MGNKREIMENMEKYRKIRKNREIRTNNLKKKN
jgi:hypothetical protein